MRASYFVPSPTTRRAAGEQATSTAAAGSSADAGWRPLESADGLARHRCHAPCAEVRDDRYQLHELTETALASSNNSPIQLSQQRKDASW
jgi:hypothetical protein